MITFCPLADLEAIARLLDDVRLNSQRTEAGAILKWLRNPDRYARFQKSGFCTMWARNLDALAVYYNAMLREWLRRGGKTVISEFDVTVLGREDEVEFPSWWEDERLHRNHRVALLCKDPQHYGRFFAEAVPEDGVYDYIWPDWDLQSETWILRPPKAGKSTPKSRVVRKIRAQSRSAQPKGRKKAKSPSRQVARSFRSLRGASEPIDLDEIN